MLPSLRGQLTPREGAGRLPALLLEGLATFPPPSQKRGTESAPRGCYELD